MSGSAIARASAEAIRSAAANGYTFADWTAEQLADDMIAYDEEVANLVGDDSKKRDFLIRCCERMLTEKAIREASK